jgi:hypothetical protein
MEESNLACGTKGKSHVVMGGLAKQREKESKLVKKMANILAYTIRVPLESSSELFSSPRLAVHRWKRTNLLVCSSGR